MCAPKHPRALILAPTRELAQQVFDNLKQYAQHTDLAIVTVYGGTSIRVQQEQLAKGVDILIATPGRLLDHLFTKKTSLNQLQILVLDEADRMLDMGFLPDIQRIMKRMPEERQTLLFSATFETRVKALAYRLMKEPVESCWRISLALVIGSKCWCLPKLNKAAMLW